MTTIIVSLITTGGKAGLGCALQALHGRVQDEKMLEAGYLKLENLSSNNSKLTKEKIVA